MYDGGVNPPLRPLIQMPQAIDIRMLDGVQTFQDRKCLETCAEAEIENASRPQAANLTIY